MHDAYNWNPDDTDMGIIPVSAAEMWELHHDGYARNYMVYGVNTFTVSWTEGQEFSEELISNET